MRLTPLLMVTALLEAPTGLLLLLVPAIVLAVLFGWDHPGAEALVVSRVAGAGVLSVGVSSWMARHDARTPGQLGVLAGVLVYNVVGSAVLLYAGAALGTIGVLLWPAVVYHVALSAWSVAGALSGSAAKRR